jgi:sugar phosphate isomerase/epimerase
MTSRLDFGWFTLFPLRSSACNLGQRMITVRNTLIPPRKLNGSQLKAHCSQLSFERNMTAMRSSNLTRRSFFGIAASLPWALRAVASGMSTSTSIPVGLEMYSVREELKKDPEGTVRAVAKMGYQDVEFYAPYFEWTEAQVKSMRKLMDDLGIRCYSTHNDENYFDTKNIDRARDFNKILGSRYMVQAWSDPKTDLDQWKALADRLNAAADKLEPAGLKVGYHNHDAEWKPLDGKRPIEVIASNTKPSVMLQLDVGTCLEAGADPVSWIQANPGRIRSIHCKDWSPDPNIGYKTLFGEGKADWKGIFQAAENIGGVEFYLIEQEGSRFSELETAQRCLAAFHTTHG